ncbi:MAG: type II toxin-antitoxin system HicB family antitoxin [Candidatus Kapabacteria bacterium]|jgi:predicted RNase H-like HicB family nuclease|nr:type II toxin-antitoxin system HicB family antitoxin [Candidatus Kapabacteria bacterium]
MKLNVIIHKAEEGGYWAEVPALPGCFSQAETMEEMLFNIKESAEAWLDVASSNIVEIEPEAEIFEIEL